MNPILKYAIKHPISFAGSAVRGTRQAVKQMRESGIPPREEIGLKDHYEETKSVLRKNGY